MTNGQKIAVAGGIGLLVASFLPWYSASAFGVTVSANGWSAGFLAWFGVVCGVAAAVIIALKAFGTATVKTGGMATEQIALGLAALSVLLVLLRWITETSFVSFGLFIGLIAAAVTAYGAFLATREAGLDIPGRGSGSAPPGGTPPTA